MGDEKKTEELVGTLLKESRNEIDRIDTRVLELLSERARMVENVAEVKRAHELPVFHPAREENVITDRREKARLLGLDPDVVEDIFRTVMRSSRITQTDSLRGRAVLPGAAVVIVGGGGAMGRCLTKWFSGSGYEVRSLETGDWERADELCAGVRLALLSVPIEITAESAAAIAPHLPADAILADITSVKKAPLEAMLRAHAGPVVGLHPMFGPDVGAMDRQIVIVSEGRDHEACRWLVDQLSSWGAVIVRADAEEHDRIMNVVQGLRHFATFAFGQYLFKSGVDLTRTLEFSSPIYRLELGMVGRLFAQDPHLYSKIIFSSPERVKIVEDFIRSLGGNLEMLEKGDEKAFLEEFRKIAAWFGPFSDQAIRESGYLIDKMIERF